MAERPSPGGLVVRFGIFELDARAGELRRHGRRVAVQGQPLRVLGMLLERPGELVTREELRQRLWPHDTFVDFEHGLNAAVNRLRDALGDSAIAPRFIETLPRRGYRFAAPVAGVRPRETARGTSIAVLPLVNLTGDAGQEYLADGLTEALITSLGKVSALGVTSRTSVMQYKGTRRALKDVARELGVDAILEGSVFKIDDRLQLAVQLIEASTDRHVWAETYVRNMAEILTLESDIVRAVAREISVSLTADESARLTPSRYVHPAAYEAYLKGRYHRARFTGTGPTKALRCYEEALAIDPGLAEAHAGIAEIYAIHGFYRLVPNMSWTQAVAHAQASAHRALELDPTLAEAHAARGHVAMNVWDWRGSERDYQRATALNPSSEAAAQGYMQLLRQTGRVDESLEVIRHLARLNPLDLLTQTMVGWPLFHARRFDEAIAQWDRVLDLNPDYALAVYNRGLGLVMAGRHAEAIEAAHKALPLMRGDAHANMLLCAAYAAAGQRTEAFEAMGVYEGLIAAGSAEPLLMAWPYALLGDETRAIECLERSLADRSPFLPNYTSEPICDALRAHPRFLPLRAAMGLD